MKKNRIQLLVTISLVILSLLLSVGCSSQNQSENNTQSTTAGASQEGANGDVVSAPGTFPITKDKITLKFFAPSIPVIVDLNTNEFTKYMEDKTNIHIEWETAPMDSIPEKTNLILASSDYPDVFFGCDLKPDQEEQYGTAEGVFVPLNGLIDKYSVNFKKVLETRQGLREAITALDGNIYSLPSLQDCFHCEYSQKMWVNQDWLSKLNMQMPTTTEEFYQMLKAFKEKDPNGNGQKDEIPLAGAIDGWQQSVDNYIMNAFIYSSGVDTDEPVRRIVKDGKVDTIVNKPEYREGLRFLNKLFKEGLIYEASFTQKFDQVKQLALNPGTEILGSAPAGHLAMFLDVVTDQERYRHFTALPPLKGPDGAQNVTHFKYFSLQPGEFVITKTNKYPEASLRYADAYYDYTVQMERAWGKEGTAWRKANEGEVGLSNQPALFKTLVPFDEQAQNIHYGWLGIEYNPDELWVGSNVTTPDMDLYSADGFEKLLYEETKKKYEPYKSSNIEVVPPLRFTREQSEVLNTITVELQNYIKESRVRFIMGDLNLDTDWDNYVASLEKIGLSKFFEIQQEAYDKVYKK